MFDASFQARLAVMEKVRRELAEPFDRMTAEIVDVLRDGGKIYFFGNGGSAADAQHLATELIDKLTQVRGTIPALALTTNTSLITAVANDKSFSCIFSRQVEAYAGKGDVLLGISTSGGSENVLAAFRMGRKIGTVNVGFCGARGFDSPDLLDHVIAVPSEDTQLIQEMHITIGHLLCFMIEDRLFRK